MMHFFPADKLDEVFSSRDPVLENIMPGRQGDVTNLGRLVEGNIALLADP